MILVKLFKVFFLFLYFLVSLSSAADHQTGDIIVHYNEKHKRYDHCALILETQRDFLVLEADWPKVTLSSLNDFIGNHQYHIDDLSLARPKVLINKSQKSLGMLAKSMLSFFREHMLGHEYNSELLLNSKSATGEKKYYCSQLVADLLNLFVLQGNKIPSHEMQFSHLFFKRLKKLGHKLPEGEHGYSPKQFVEDTMRFDHFNFKEDLDFYCF